MDGGTMRVPNRGWDETPRGTWGKSNKRWDETPRSVRETSPDGIDEREWEEEQVRLDRDWYNDDQGVAVSGQSCQADVRATKNITHLRNGKIWVEKRRRSCSRKLSSVKLLVRPNS
jgi:pre-mRNA-splicing factor ATP-dependent RNA helicase DHX38/PRP16